jgi:hypothetical protein
MIHFDPIYPSTSCFWGIFKQSSSLSFYGVVKNLINYKRNFLKFIINKILPVIVICIGRSNEILGWVGVGKIKPFRTV